MSRWVEGTGDLRHIELLRMAAGPLVIAHLWGFLGDAAAGVTYSDGFFLPYATWYPQLPGGAYLSLLWLAVPAAAMLSVGLATRYAAWYCAVFVGYNLFLSRTHFGHNRAFLLVILIGLALLAPGRTRSIDAVIRRRRNLPVRSPVGPLWPIALMRFEVVAMFLGSGISKLVDPDWFGGLVTRLRVEQWSANAAGRGVPGWALEIASAEAFHTVFAKFAVVTEIGIAVGLLVRAVRPTAVWVAVWFHVFIEVFASVQVFSFAAIAALVIWVSPGPRRALAIRGNGRGLRVLARAVRLLDWTGRFRVVRDRSGAAAVALGDAEGAGAARLALSRLPALFVLAAPLNLAWIARIWDRRLRRVFGDTER